eukprot:scaffold6942_cov72-Phaeocystis_antarctica.AAC.9
MDWKRVKSERDDLGRAAASRSEPQSPRQIGSAAAVVGVHPSMHQAHAAQPAHHISDVEVASVPFPHPFAHEGYIGLRLVEQRLAPHAAASERLPVELAGIDRQT